MGKHHLVLGELEDYLTGKIIEDSHDERYRQKLARILVEKKGYEKEDLESNRPLTVSAGEKQAVIKVDIVVWIDRRVGMIVKYAPGSLVTRYRPCLSASRLLAGYEIPFVVVTNGEDADVLDGHTGNVTGSTLDAIPGKSELKMTLKDFAFTELSPKKAELETRILYAYEVDDSCACDGNICRL